MNYFEEISNLREREKELMCLYKTDNILGNFEEDLQIVLKKLVTEIPKGWQFPAICFVRVTADGLTVCSPGFTESRSLIKEDIKVDQKKTGMIEVFYSDNKYAFLKEEVHLLSALAQRIGNHLFHRKIKTVLGSKKEIMDGEHWKWRKEMAAVIAAKTDYKKLSVKAMYVIGSVKNATSTAHSDIDLIVHVSGQKPCPELVGWLNGWSMCLAEMNRVKTGVEHPGGLLDIHYISDDDLRKKSSYAVMIDSHENSAHLLK